MKKLFLLIVAGVISVTTGYAQNRCATTTYNQQMEMQNPQVAKNRAKIESRTAQLIQQNPNYKASSMVITIPVVVHVIWKTAGQNIPDAKIFSQIDQLNDDFARLNSDTGNTPSAFQSIGANTNIQFCLAQRDPNGVATTGIVRTQTTANSFSTNDAIKFDAQGGDDAWPSSQYLNLWIGNLGGGLLGYAQFPGGAANTDGVVVIYNSVGSIANPATGGAPYNLGRTATHEVGHWVNLFHINGDANCGNDQVADTPPQDQLHGGCPNAPYHTNVCGAGTSPNGEMFMNYMDYTDDACMNIFSAGQSARMNTCMSGPRASLITSLGCLPPTTAQNDAGISAIAAPTGSSCLNSVTPDVTLFNYGIAVLTSVTINYQIDAGTINTFAWSGNLAQGASANVTLPVINGIAAGPHTFSCYTSNPNATTDADASNDGSTSNFTVTAGVVGTAIPYQQGFEPVAFPPPSWTIDNPDGLTTWVRTTAASKTGIASMYIDNANYTNANGQVDEAVTLPLDLTAVANPAMTFQVAYTYWTVPYQYSDTLEVLISIDCGGTWTSLYKKWGNTLATAPGQGSDFFPNPSQWRLETISLVAYSASNNALFKFRNITDYENNLFVDDINITNTTALTKIDDETYFEISPNPSNGKFILTVRQGTNSSANVIIYNSIGQKVFENQYNGNQIHENIDISKFSKGIYEVVLNVNNNKVSQKIVVQ